MVCGIIELFQTECEVSNNFTLVVEILISIIFGIGLAFYFYKKGKNDTKELKKIVIEQSKIIHEQNTLMNTNRNYVLRQIFLRLQNLKNNLNYFYDQYEIKSEDFKTKYQLKTDEPLSKPNITMQHNQQTNFWLPDVQYINDLLYLVDSVKNLIIQKDIIGLKNILESIKELFEYDDEGFLKIVSDMNPYLTITYINELDMILKNLEKYEQEV